MKRNRKHLGNGSKSWRLEAWKWKVETGKLQNRVWVERIRPSSSRSVATAHGWTGLTWQQLVATLVVSNRSWFQQLTATDRVLWWLVADLRVVGCNCLVQLFVFVFVICEVVVDRQRVCVLGLRLCEWIVECSVCVCVVHLQCVYVLCTCSVCHSVGVCAVQCAACGFYSSMCAAAYVTMCVWLSGWQLVTSVLVFCVCAVQQHDKFKFISRDKFLSLFLSHPLSFFFLFLQKEIVLFLNNLSNARNLSIAWRWVDDKISFEWLNWTKTEKGEDCFSPHHCTCKMPSKATLFSLLKFKTSLRRILTEWLLTFWIGYWCDSIAVGEWRGKYAQ